MYPYLGAAQAAPEAPPPRVLTDRGWVTLFPLAIYSNKRKQFEALPLEALVEALVAAESKYALDRIDDRDKVEATIASGSAVGTKKTATIKVPDDEIWFLNRLVLVSPAESGIGVGDIVQVNARVSSWKYPDSRAGTDVNENGRTYWSAAKGDAALNTYTIDLPAQGELGEELRLIGGDSITLEATLTGVAAGADLTAGLTPYGRKVKRLVE